MKPEAYYIEKSKEGSPTLFSLYTTPKPEVIEPVLGVANAFWLTDHLAYLQELEFKVELHRPIYVNGQENLKFTFFNEVAEKEIDKENVYQFFIWLLKTKKGISNIKFISHYFIGQTVPSSAISYVREVEVCKECGGIVFHVEDYYKDINHYECDSCGETEIVTEWQPSPEPEKYIALGGKRLNTKPNFAYDRWLTYRAEGKVQATINLNI